MVPRSHLQLLSLPGQPPGSGGFKLTGTEKDGHGVCRVWLRRVDAWDRYPDPRFDSDEWDVRAYRRTDSAFALIEEFTPASLDDLAERFDFNAPASALAGLKPNGDQVHDRVLAWAKSTLGAADAPAPATVEAPAGEAETASEPETEVEAESAPEAEVEAAPRAEAEAETASEDAAAPEPEAVVEATPEPEAVVEATPEPEVPSTPASPPRRDVEPTGEDDAWDEIAVLAERATGAHRATTDDEKS